MDFILLFNETIAVIFIQWTPGNTLPTYQVPGKDKTGSNSQGNLIYVFSVKAIATKIDMNIIWLGLPNWKFA